MSIQLNGINCFYGAHQALFDITLDCPQGETLVLLGPSGAGKSSLLRVLNLLEMPRSGTLSIAGNRFDFTKTPSDKAIRDLRQNVGMVFQQYNLWPHLTVVQNLIEAPCRVLGLTKEQAMARAEKLLERLPFICELAKAYVGVDPVKDPIPVRPTAHYTMGGIETDQQCETRIKGLFAVGECSSVGLHGANRLGSNSLAELVVFGRLAGEQAMQRATEAGEANRRAGRRYREAPEGPGESGR